MKLVPARRCITAIFLLACLLSGCTRHDDGFARLQSRADKWEAIYTKDPNNYLAKRELAVIYSAFYLHDIQAGNNSASAHREKALTLTHEALEKAPLLDRADLGICLERLGYDEEALSVYEKFLEDAQHTTAPFPPYASNAPPVLHREAEASWGGLIANIQTRADMLKKAAAAKKPTKP
jgi:tetratricopeptide (TPR) repeat protein